MGFVMTLIVIAVIVFWSIKVSACIHRVQDTKKRSQDIALQNAINELLYRR